MINVEAYFLHIGGRLPEGEAMLNDRAMRLLEFRRIIRTTEAAILVDLELGGETWIPKSVVESKGRDYSAGPGNGSMMVMEWWCAKELD